MTRPRIAVPTPTSFDPTYNQRCWPQYAQAVERSGGEAVAIPLNLTPTAIADLINTCQGVLLPGSPADVNPHKYGQEPLPTTAPPDHARENVDELLIQDAHNLYKPILGICFGLQILNVWRGGTLIQDLTPLPVNHAASASVGVAHTVVVASVTRLAGLIATHEAPRDAQYLNLPENLPVNSSHHQAVGIPGDGLKVSARCPQDGVVEALEGGQSSDPRDAHFVLGLQWHPERTAETDPAAKAIFDSFIAGAAAWVPRTVRVSVG